jgi:hypothetical protein
VRTAAAGANLSARGLRFDEIGGFATASGAWPEYMAFGGAPGSAVMDRVRPSEIQLVSDQGTGGTVVIAQ